MSRWDSRSNRPSRSSIFSMLRSAGRARAGAVHTGEVIERLEERVLLAGDEPNFNQVFGTPNPLSPPVITLDAGGAGTSVTGSGSSTIFPAGDNDVFKFTAPSDDFVTLWADTLSSGSTLDSRVEVYTGTPGGTATLVAAGSTQGTLTSGVFKDGWVGFKATAGTDYFVVVKSDLLAGTGSIGDYVLRMDAKSTTFPTLSTSTGVGTVNGTITLPGSDIVYKVTTGSQAAFNSVMTMLAKADAQDFDPRLDVYNVNGVFIKGDSDSGNLTDSYLAIGSGTTKTFYVRVRSDEIGNPVLRPSTATFTLALDGIATTVNLDPVTRLGTSGTRSVPTQQDISFLRFQSQGTGLSFITIRVGFPGALPDSAVRLYDSSGAQIGFNELNNAFSRLLIQLTGGENYFIVVENFGGTSGGAYIAEIEAHHTYDPVNTTPVLDDHVSRPTGFNIASPPAFGTPEWFAAQRQFELATPIVWGTPENAAAPDFAPGLPPLETPVAPIEPDHSKVIIGAFQGRIHNTGDTDLFQFTAPVDMNGEFPGISDGDPDQPLWRAHYRPATSVQILVNAQTLFNSQVRIFDSNLTLIYGPNDILLTPGFPDPAGSLDPASFPPALPIPTYGYTFAANQPARIEIWAGEVYYLEISVRGTGATTARSRWMRRKICRWSQTSGRRSPSRATSRTHAKSSSTRARAKDATTPTPRAARCSRRVRTYAAAPGIGSAGVNLGRTYFANLKTPPVPPGLPPGAVRRCRPGPVGRGRAARDLPDVRPGRDPVAHGHQPVPVPRRTRARRRCVLQPRRSRTSSSRTSSSLRMATP